MKYPVNNPRVTQHFTPSHQGLDLVSQDGDFRLFAVCRGKVYAKEFHKTGGFYVILRHPWIDNREFETYYGHLETLPDLRVGQWVEEGQLVGTMGTTGLVTGRHVHFETRIERGKVDPELFLDNYRVVSDVVRPAYISLYEVFFNQTPSEIDQKNFIDAGENFRREYGYVKERLGV